MKNILVNHFLKIIVFGLFTGSTFLYLGVIHGTQSEFYLISGEIDYIYCLKTFLVWFLLGTIVAFIVYCAYRFILHGLEHLKHK